MLKKFLERELIITLEKELIKNNQNKAFLKKAKKIPIQAN